jgi:hypothetical protein
VAEVLKEAGRCAAVDSCEVSPVVAPRHLALARSIRGVPPPTRKLRNPPPAHRDALSGPPYDLPCRLLALPDGLLRRIAARVELAVCDMQALRLCCRATCAAVDGLFESIVVTSGNARQLWALAGGELHARFPAIAHVALSLEALEEVSGDEAATLAAALAPSCKAFKLTVEEGNPELVDFRRPQLLAARLGAFLARLPDVLIVSVERLDDLAPGRSLTEKARASQDAAALFTG